MASDDRRTAAQRGYGHRWRVERAAYLALNPWCVMRAAGCGMLADVVDHRVPHRGDEVLFWDRGNWQGLCAHCHNSHKQAAEQGTATGERDHKGRLLPR
jgi:5-methylcytosine-specific restriction endonuclease McrA